MKFTKKFNSEKKEKQKAKKFSPSASFLIVGTLVIMSFFRGNTSHILLLILFTGCGLFNLIKHIKSKRQPKKQYNARRRNNDV